MWNDNKVDIAALTDCELAKLIREMTKSINHFVSLAHNRELVVRYEIRSQHNANPRLNVTVMTEVA